MPVRKIIHVDLDAFFASIEQMDNSHLKGKPVIVGGTGRRGVVSTASYEARKFGVHSGQPMAKARKLCPKGIFLPVRMQRYREISAKVFNILSLYSPKVEPLSIDEAFLDVTDCKMLFGRAEDIAKKIKIHIKKEVGLACSVGIAPNKFLAKLASDIKKPDGFVVVREEEKEDFLKNIPIKKMWGVGRVTEKKLKDMGVYTIGDLRRMSLFFLKSIFGRLGERLYNLSRGIDEEPVFVQRKAKSIASEVTFSQDVYDRKALEQTLFELSCKISDRLKDKGLWARSCQVKVRFSDFTTITRSKTYDEDTNLAHVIWQRAKEILNKKVDLSSKTVRLVGISVFNLTSQKQMQLFLEKEDRLEKLV